MRKIVLFSVLGLSLLALSNNACIRRNTKKSSNDLKEAIKQFQLDQLPEGVQAVDVNFEDKIHLVGWKADPATAAPGAAVHVTVYWKKFGDLEPGWKLFTHVSEDDVHNVRWNIDCEGPIREDREGNKECPNPVYPPSDWENGKIIVDSIDFTVPNDYTSPKVRFLVGVWKDNARLTIRNLEQSDGDKAANVIAVPTGVKPPTAAPSAPPKRDPPTVTVPKFAKTDAPNGAAITIDGKLDEPQWARAGFIPSFSDPGDGHIPTPDKLNANVHLLWDDTNLYAGFVVNDPNASSPFKPTDIDPHIWAKAHGIELMIQPGDPPTNKDYYEIQADAVGAVFDTHWDDYNLPITGGPDDDHKVFGHMDWASKAKVAVNVEAGKRYTVEMAIPWASFVKPSHDSVTFPPAEGATWRMNFYAFVPGQSPSVAWSPIFGEGNFHRSSRFGFVRFVGVPAARPVPGMPPHHPGPHQP